MTHKQMTIDDCIHLDEWKHCDICEKLIKTKDGANGKKREYLLTEEDLRCDFYPNCYYKQLKRKEQECEQQKAELELFKTSNQTTINQLKAKNEELKEKYKWFDHYKEQALYNKNLCNKQYDQIDQLKKENDRLKKQLESTKGLVTVGNKQLMEALFELQKQQHENCHFDKIKDLTKEL